MTLGYHYTSLQAAIDIVHGRTLRGHPVATFNDPSEMHYMVERLTASIRARLQRLTPEEKEGPVGHMLMDLPEECGILISNVLRPFAICFSNNSDLLTMWRAYGDDGAGVSLGFLLELLVEEVTRVDGRARVSKCVYKHGEQNELLEDVLSEAIRGIEARSSDSPGSSPAYGLANDILTSRPWFIKHPAYENEGEVRIAFTLTAPLEIQTPDNDGKRYHPYFAVSLKPGMLRSCMVGPGPHQKRSITVLNEVLLAAGYDFVASASPIPYSGVHPLQRR